MLSNAYLLAKIGADTAENEQHSAEKPRRRRAGEACRRRRLLHDGARPLLHDTLLRPPMLFLILILTVG